MKLPPEAGAPEGVVGKLLRWLYGMRGAAQGCEKEFQAKLESIGCKRGKATPVVFYRSEDETSLVVHGDDFTFLGLSESLKELEAQMRDWWDIKLRAVVGDARGDSKEVTILNRVLRWDGHGLDLEADPRHRSAILEELGLDESSKGVTIPCEETGPGGGDDELLDRAEARRFRGLAARANYLGLGRPDIQAATKRICYGMSNPSVESMTRMKRLARYLLEVPQGIARFDSDGANLDKLMVYVDSEWAVDKCTRKSTSGGIVTWGGAMLKSWSRTQGSIAMSSGEAELYAAVKAAAEGLGVPALVKDMGFDTRVEVIQDSNSAKGTMFRLGLGKVKNLETDWLWVQEAVRNGRIHLRKICGKVNPSDLLTTPTSHQDVTRLSGPIGYRLVIRDNPKTR